MMVRVQFPVVILLNETPDDQGLPSVLLRPILGQPVRQPGDRYVLGWSGTVEADDMEAAALETATAHTLDDRPSGQTHRSVLVGDIVVVGECCYLITNEGAVATDPPGEVDRRPWAEVVTERYISQ
jgi:hypothetical protein